MMIKINTSRLSNNSEQVPCAQAIYGNSEEIPEKCIRPHIRFIFSLKYYDFFFSPRRTVHISPRCTVYTLSFGVFVLQGPWRNHAILFISCTDCILILLSSCLNDHAIPMKWILDPYVFILPSLIFSDYYVPKIWPRYILYFSEHLIWNVFSSKIELLCIEQSIKIIINSKIIIDFNVKMINIMQPLKLQYSNIF